MINILLSNDDGADAPGIQTLYKQLAATYAVTLVAPERDRSATSSALTLDRPLRVNRIGEQQYAVNGTPCDCVHLGSHRLMPSRPDIVIAGINRGANLGDDVLYSGTVAAAMEGRSLGYPAIAVSLASKQCHHYQTAAQVVQKLMLMLAGSSLESNIVLNVNVPDLPLEKIKGFQLTRLGSRHRADTIVPAQDPKGRDIFWLGPPSEPQDVGEGTDFNAVDQGFVSITPIVVDVTAYNSFNSVKEWMSEL
jgi:5'-nucleotidase